MLCAVTAVNEPSRWQNLPGLVVPCTWPVDEWWWVRDVVVVRGDRICRTSQSGWTLPCDRWDYTTYLTAYSQYSTHHCTTLVITRFTLIHSTTCL